MPVMDRSPIVDPNCLSFGKGKKTWKDGMHAQLKIYNSAFGKAASKVQIALIIANFH